MANFKTILVIGSTILLAGWVLAQPAPLVGDYATDVEACKGLAAITQMGHDRSAIERAVDQCMFLKLKQGAR